MSASINEKVSEILEEMKREGYWKKQLPVWVCEYNQRSLNSGNDFTEWLQFVYLPNLVQQSNQGMVREPNEFIVPQAMTFFGNNIKKGKLLQLLIELDACL